MMMYERAHDGDHQGADLAELSNAMVRLYKDLFGRGPTKAHSSYAGPNVLVTSLENSFTPAERSMVGLGENVRLEETRLFFQRASRAQFIATVEDHTGRKVRAFVSGTDSENDVSSEVFYLEPQDSDA
jgi:uncharacterized protein YbcI